MEQIIRSPKLIICRLKVSLFWGLPLTSKEKYVKASGVTKKSQVNSIPVRISNRRGEISKTFGKNITNFSNIQNLVNIHVTNDNQILNQLADRCDELTKPNRIKLFHLNIQSIKNRNHLIQIRELISDNKVDVLAISETWLNSSISNAEVEIQGYKIHRLDRKRKRGGGVCIYIRNNLKSKVLNDLSYISDLGLHKLWVQIQ